MRALLELMAALKGTVTVALARARVRPRTLTVGAGLGVAALVLGAAQLVGDDPDGAAPDGGLVRDVPAGDGQLPSPGDGPVPGGNAGPLVAGLNEAPVPPPRSGSADAVGRGTGAGTGDVVGAEVGGPGSTAPGGGPAEGGGTVPPTTTQPSSTDTTTSPGTTATTAAPAPVESGGVMQALLSHLGLD